MTKTYNVTIDVPAARAYFASPLTIVNEKEALLALNDDDFAKKVFEIAVGINAFDFFTATEV